MSRPISAPWGNVYATSNAPSYPLQSTPITAPVTLGQAIQQKKPNKSRFTSIVPEPSPSTSNPYTLTSQRSAPPLPVQSPYISNSTNSNLSPQPDNLKAFVVRAFGSCSSAPHREFISNVLKEKIAKVTAQGQLHSYRWDLEPVPIYDPSSTTTTSASAPLSSTIIHSSKNIPTSYSSGLSTFCPYTNPNTTTTTFTTTATTTETKRDKKRKGRTIDTTMTIEDSKISSTVFEGAAKLNTPQEIKMREQRANRFQNDTTTNTTTITYNNNQNENGRKKKAKHNPNSSKIALLMSNTSNNSNNDNEFNLNNLKITGICQKLEKDYLRLTSAPLPSVVRPENILKKSIQLIKKKWSDETVDYVYMCSQLKSIRQDLTVQHIQNG